MFYICRVFCKFFCFFSLFFSFWFWNIGRALPYLPDPWLCAWMGQCVPVQNDKNKSIVYRPLFEEFILMAFWIYCLILTPNKGVFHPPKPAIMTVFSWFYFLPNREPCSKGFPIQNHTPCLGISCQNPTHPSGTSLYTKHLWVPPPGLYAPARESWCMF